MSENAESIQIHELDENGVRLAAAEIEAELEHAVRFNPWLIALWVLNGLAVVLTVLGFIGISQSMPGSYDASSVQTTLERTYWLSLLAPYTVVFLVFALLGVLATLVTHAVLWERRRRV
ncbi:hypothetical protein [Psychromicrobium sp. YIM B11713]|uniref:hypothetical protein n=1 Tax=Psychromicrobium sp. YIM B11713 TaxID=3145233 RepID=UPI00374F0176